MSPIDGSSDPNPEIATKETKHGTIIVDAIDADLLRHASIANSSGKYPYVRWYSHYDGKRTITFQAHRVIMERMTGAPIPKGMVVDHVNGNRLDNRRDNLRVCTRVQNSRNSKTQSNSKTGLKGATFRKNTGKFGASIRHGGVRTYLGTFNTAEEAHAAYVAAAIKVDPEFANDGEGCLILR